MKRGYRNHTIVLPMACLLAAIAFPSFSQDEAHRSTAGGPAQIETVNVVLKEWRLNLDKQEVKAGPVTFHVRNLGSKEHELVIIKTRLHDTDLPLRQGRVSETDAGELIGEIEEFPAGETREATFALMPGSYALICNMLDEEEDGKMESHYMNGMHVPFTVLNN